LNVDIHAGITGVVTLNAIDQTLPQLLSRIANQVDMRWELEGPNLAVMPDTPYLRIYRIDYLNMDRKTTGTVGVSAQVTGSSGATGGGGAGGGANISTISVTNSSSNTFWTTLEKNVKDILHETDKIMPATGPAQAAAPAPQPPGAAQGPGSAAATTAPAEPNVTFREAASVIASPEAGVLTIRATSRQHEKIQQFLDQVLANVKRQVLIEATIVEVQLNNQYQRGIDWSVLRQGTSGISLTQATSLAGLPSTPTIPNVFTVNAAAANFGNLSAVIRLLDSFGTVRVLSSPRMSVLNNQTAVLRVVDNIVYFTIQATTISGTATAAPVTNFSTDRKSVV
jgi:MSHA biogenesis protein MshL